MTLDKLSEMGSCGSNSSSPVGLKQLCSYANICSTTLSWNQHRRTHRSTPRRTRTTFPKYEYWNCRRYTKIREFRYGWRNHWQKTLFDQLSKVCARHLDSVTFSTSWTIATNFTTGTALNWHCRFQLDALVVVVNCKDEPTFSIRMMSCAD